MPDNEADGMEDGMEGTADSGPPVVPSPAEAELLAAFSRLAPAGSNRWNFEESMSRLNPQPILDSSAPHPSSSEASAPGPPWPGLPGDLWARGRSAQVGQRMVGDVVAAMADFLAADSRALVSQVNEANEAQAEISRQRFLAAWDGLRFLAARLERLERRSDVVTDLFPDLSRDVPEPDLAPWVDRLGQWFSRPAAEGPVVHGESSDGSLVRALAAAGYDARGIEPRAERVWASAGGPPVALGEVAERLVSVADGELAGLILSGSIDRLDLPGKLLLAELAISKTAPGATVAVLPMDQRAWSDGSPVTVSDLTPGRPLHPETWAAVLERTGLTDVRWHRPEGGELIHVVVGRRP
jgi:hypothetical protein